MFDLRKYQKTKFLIGSLLFGGLCIGSLCLVDDLFKFQLLAVLKARRVFSAGLNGYNEQSHEFAGKKILKVIKENQEIYLKIGFLINQLRNFFPDSFANVFKEMDKEIRERSFEEMFKFMEKEYKLIDTNIRNVFYDIDPIPIGIGSTCQVYKGYLINGEEVAIKVQSPELFYSAHRDYLMMGYLSSYFAKIFSIANYDWLMKDLTKKFHNEINFLSEVDFSREIGYYFQFEDDFSFPNNITRLSTPKITVMDIEKGHFINDKKFLSENNIDIDYLGTQLIKFFNKSIFMCGFLYVDIDPKNILLKQELDSKGRKKLKILFLDHGQYQVINKDVRHNYSQIWRGIFTQNEKILEKACKNLGIENYKLFSTLLTYKEYNSLMSESKKYQFEDIFKYDHNEEKRVHQDIVDFHKEISQIFSKANSEIFSIIRVKESLRTLLKEIGFTDSKIEETFFCCYTEIFKDENIDNVRLMKEYYKIRFSRWYNFISLKINKLFNNMSNLFMYAEGNKIKNNKNLKNNLNVMI